MKRTLEIVLLLAIIGIIVQLIVQIIKDDHEVQYEITSNKTIFDVKEIYQDGYYHILVVNKDYKFSILLQNDYNKAKKIIDDIKFAKNDDLMCIYPITDNKNTNIVCANKNNIYSYDYLKNNSLVKEFVSKLKNEGFSNKAWDDEVKSIKHDNITYYQDNFKNNIYLYIWKYNGFYILKDKVFTTNDLYNRDTYTNNPVLVYDKYYVVADYSKKYDFSDISIYDMTNNTVKKVYFDTSLSYNSYFNGMINNKIYLLDKDNLVQYEINPKNKSYNVVGNKELNAVYYNKEWKTINIYDMVKKEYKFVTEDVPEQLKKYPTYIGDDMYIYENNDKIYQFDPITDTHLLLYENKDITDIKISGNDVYFIIENTLYAYDKLYGIMPLVRYKEFAFNKSNMYAVYTK